MNDEPLHFGGLFGDPVPDEPSRSILPAQPDLFPREQHLSPRLSWMRRHHVALSEEPDGRHRAAAIVRGTYVHETAPTSEEAFDALTARMVGWGVAHWSWEEGAA